MSYKKKSKDTAKTMTDVITECIQDGYTKEKTKEALKKAFPNKSTDSIRTMVNKHFSSAESPVAVSPVKIEKLSKKELLEMIKAREEVPDTESNSESEAQEPSREKEEEKAQIHDTEEEFSEVETKIETSILGKRK